jgi:hypothetical protein
VDSLPSFLLLDHGNLGIAHETKSFSQDAMQAAMQKPLVRLPADNECMMKTDQNPTRIAHPRRQAPVSQCTSHISLPNMQAAKPIIHCHLHTCAVPDIDRHADRPKPWAASSFRARFRIQSHVHAYVGLRLTSTQMRRKRLKHVCLAKAKNNTTSMSKHTLPSKAKTPTQKPLSARAAVSLPTQNISFSMP